MRQKFGVKYRGNCRASFTKLFYKVKTKCLFTTSAKYGVIKLKNLCRFEFEKSLGRSKFFRPKGTDRPKYLNIPTNFRPKRCNFSTIFIRRRCQQ